MRRAFHRTTWPVAVSLVLAALVALPASTASAVNPKRAPNCQARIDKYIAMDHSSISTETFNQRVAWMQEQCVRNNVADEIAEDQGILAPELFPPGEYDRNGTPLACMALYDARWGKHDNDWTVNPLLDPDFPGGMAPLNVPGDFMIAVIDGKAHFMIRNVVWAIEGTDGEVVNPVLLKQETWYNQLGNHTHASVWFDEAYVPRSIWVEIMDEADMAFGYSGSLLPGRVTLSRTWFTKSGCHDKRGPIVIPQILINHAKSLGWLKPAATTTESHYLTMEHNGDPNVPGNWYVSDVPVTAPSNVNWTLGHPWFYGDDAGVAISTVPPTVAVAAPAPEVVARGTTTIQVDASDISDAAGTLDVAVSFDDTGLWHPAAWNAATGHYEYAWDTTTVADGARVVHAKAVDSDGNTGEASPYVLRVGNVGPALAVDTPGPEALLAGDVQVGIIATDTVDAADMLAVDVSTDGGASWSPAAWSPTTGRHVFDWATAGAPDGAATLDVRAIDSDLNETRTQETFTLVNGWDYAATVMARGPVAYWRLGEAAGKVAIDASGSGHDASYKGGPVLGAPGLVGAADTAVALDGRDDRVRVADSQLLNRSRKLKAYTVEVWFAADDTGRRRMLYEQGGANRGLSIYVQNGKLHAGAWNLTAKKPENVWGPVFASTPITEGAVHHAVVVFDKKSDRLAIYLDGAPAAAKSGIGVLRRHPGNIGIGAVAGDTRSKKGPLEARRYFPGTIDEFAIYPVALDPFTIRAHYLVGSSAS